MRIKFEEKKTYEGNHNMGKSVLKILENRGHI